MDKYVTLNNPKNINIDPNSMLDIYYRYKMPQLHISYTKGQIYFINIKQVAKSLQCESNIIIKYFGSSLATLSNVKNNSISGKFTVDELSNIMIKFINKYILCSVCNLPELYFTKNDDNVISICNSCGESKNITDKNIKKYITSVARGSQ